MNRRDFGDHGGSEDDFDLDAEATVELPVEEMAALDFVQWDRYAGSPDDFSVFGWIARGDGRADFVVLNVVPEGIGFTTSSAEWSAEISLRLRGEPSPTHNGCLRVEDDPLATDLHNLVRLSPMPDTGTVFDPGDGSVPVYFPGPGETDAPGEEEGLCGECGEWTTHSEEDCPNVDDEVTAEEDPAAIEPSDEVDAALDDIDLDADLTADEEAEAARLETVANAMIAAEGEAHEAGEESLATCLAILGMLFDIGGIAHAERDLVAIRDSATKALRDRRA